MHGLDKRLAALEQRSLPQGRLAILMVDAHATPAELEQGLVEARAAVGEYGRVLHVQYVSAPRPAWWGDEQDRLMAGVERREPYTMKVYEEPWHP